MLERELEIEPISFATRMVGILDENQRLVDKIKALRLLLPRQRRNYERELEANSTLMISLVSISLCASIVTAVVLQNFHFNDWIMLLGAIGTLIGLSYFPYRFYSKKHYQIQHEMNEKMEEKSIRTLEKELSAYEVHIMQTLRLETIQFECLAHVDTLFTRMRVKYGKELFNDNKTEEIVFQQRVRQLRKDFIKAFHIEDNHHTYQTLISLFFKVQQIELDIEEYYQNNAVLQQQAQTFTAFEKKYQQFFHEQNAELQAIVRHTL